MTQVNKSSSHEENFIQVLAPWNIIKNDSRHFECNIQTIQLFTIEYFIITETTELSKNEFFFEQSPGSEVKAHSVAKISSSHLTVASRWLGRPGSVAYS